jgi:hypothetical protein
MVANDCKLDFAAQNSGNTFMHTIGELRNVPDPPAPTINRALNRLFGYPLGPR